MVSAPVVNCLLSTPLWADQRQPSVRVRKKPVPDVSFCAWFHHGVALPPDVAQALPERLQLANFSVTATRFRRGRLVSTSCFF